MEAVILEAQKRLEIKKALAVVVDVMQEPVPEREPEAAGLTLAKVLPISLNLTGRETEKTLESCRYHPGQSVDCCEECERQEQEQALAQQRASERKRVVEREKLERVQIGLRHRGAQFADYHPVGLEAGRVKLFCEKYAETFGERLKNGDNILMLGNPGTGKNMLAACICTKILEAGYTPLHTTAIKLIRRIRESWGSETEKEQDLIDSFVYPDLLVIDEVGKQYGKEAEKVLLFEVLNDRYEAVKPTIIISNLSVVEMEAYLGALVIDRLHEGQSRVLQFTWGSYRRGV